MRKLDDRLPAGPLMDSRDAGNARPPVSQQPFQALRARVAAIGCFAVGVIGMSGLSIHGESKFAARQRDGRSVQRVAVASGIRGARPGAPAAVPTQASEIRRVLRDTVQRIEHHARTVWRDSPWGNAVFLGMLFAAD